jgi:hypothetical protein
MYFWHGDCENMATGSIRFHTSGSYQMRIVTWNHTRFAAVRSEVNAPKTVHGAVIGA